MQKFISTVKYWIIKWFVSESNNIAWRDKGQVVRLNTAGDWKEGYKCIWIMTFWCIDNLKNGGYSSGTSVPYKI